MALGAPYCGPPMGSNGALADPVTQRTSENPFNDLPVRARTGVMDSFEPTFRTSTRGDWVRLRTLVMLRWLAIAGQFVAVIVASQVLMLDLPLDLCMTAIGISVIFNIIASSTNPTNKRLDEASLLLTLLFDLAQLITLLFLTGGLSNPFSLLVLVPVTIAATALSLPATLTLSAVAIGLITLLVNRSFPLMLADGTVISPPTLFIAGTWVSLVIGIIFLAAYARRVTNETFSMSEALGATQMALAREQRLTALGGVVAAAAHELGTPLATIKLVTSELEEELEDRPELLEDVRLIQSQTARCRDILRDMGRSGRDDALVRVAPLSVVIAEAAEPHTDRGIRVILRIDGVAGDEPEPADQPDVLRKPELIHGIRNLVQNAVDFANATVWIDAIWDDKTVTLTIGDDGRGYPADLIGRLGDPYVGRRGQRRKRTGQRQGYEGMGLGLFIAKTLLERIGATLRFSNTGERPVKTDASEELPPEFANPTGALVEVHWPRAALESDRDITRGPLGRNQLNLP